MQIPPSHHRPLVALLNLTRFVLFPAGFMLAAWLLFDAALPYLLSAAEVSAVRDVSEPIVAIAAPAVVGYWTNYIAIKMLFRPRRPNKVWQGLIPQRKDELTQMMAEGVRERLISPEIIRAYLHETGAVREFLDRNVSAVQDTLWDEEFKHDLKVLCTDVVDGYLHDERTQAFVDDLVHRFVHKARSDGIQGKLLLWLAKRREKDLKRFAREVLPQFVDELDEILEGIDVLLQEVPPRVAAHMPLLEDAISEVIARALEEVDVAKIVKGQLDLMDERQLEDMLTSNIAEEITFIQTAGGLFGFIVGVAVTLPVTRVPLVVVLPAVVALLMWATTEREADPDAPEEVERS